MKALLPFLSLLFGLWISASAESGREAAAATPSAVSSTPTVGVHGDLRQWHRVTVAFEGPASSEDATPNPFLDYRLDVTFTHPASGRSFVVPGYYAADGAAGETGAAAGNIWRVHFAPPELGTWNFAAQFSTGTDVAVSDEAAPGGAATLNGDPDGEVDGTFEVVAGDKAVPDNRARGLLEYVGGHHLRWAGTGGYFLKQGADSPENLLAYSDFDGDFKSDGRADDKIKTWGPHVADWQPGDPTWRNGRGKGLIGAINYLADEGLNAFSFLTMNIDGDDKNVFPYTAYGERVRLDVSRLDQWEVVFTHADARGMYLHFKTQETENETLLDGGGVGTQRKLYYRELIARFAHHLALNWNLGEESKDQTDAQRKAMAQYFRDHDPYGHPIVIHTYPGEQSAIYTPMLGTASELTGVSIQTNSKNFAKVFGWTKEWIDKSATVGKPWVVAVDEPGDASHALVPDADDPTHDVPRKRALWGTLMAGGAGNEWYFGYSHAQSDLTLQDFRSRDLWWDQCRHALEFFSENGVPFWEMHNRNDLVGNAADNIDDGFCLAKEGSEYVVFLPSGGTRSLDLTDQPGTFDVRWFDPRNGGALQPGSVTTVTGGGSVSLGSPPAPATADWVALVSSPKKLLFIRGADRSGGFLEAKNDADRTEQLADLGNTATNNGNHGWGALKVLLEGEGFIVEQVAEPLESGAPGTGQTIGAPLDLAALDLDEYAAVVLASNNAVYGTAAIDALEAYVRGGGAALFISDANFGSSWCDAPDSDQQFLDRFGLAVNQDLGLYTVDLAKGGFVVPNHPIFDGVDTFMGEGVSPGRIPAGPPPAGVSITRLAAASGNTRNNDGTPGSKKCQGTTRPTDARDGSLIVATADAGRVAIHFDRNTFFNANGAGTDITEHDNAQYARNLFAWLAGEPGGGDSVTAAVAEKPTSVSNP